MTEATIHDITHPGWRDEHIVRQKAEIERLAATEKRLTAENEKLEASWYNETLITRDLTAENEKLIKTFGEIERIANIAPANNANGSLAERMNKVWLLARGHEQIVGTKP